MSNKNSPVNILLLCATFLNKNTVKLFNLPGYIMVTNNRVNHKGGGVTILIKDGIPHKRRKDPDIFWRKKLNQFLLLSKWSIQC